MPSLLDEIKSGVEYGTSLGTLAGAAFSFTSTSVDKVEAAIQTGGKGGTVGGILGGTANGTLCCLKKTRHFVDKAHKKCMAVHAASHDSSESCIVCNPQKSLDLS